MLLSSVPVFAAKQDTAAQNAYVSDDMEVNGTNSFGGLLADAINANEEASEAENGYNVFSVEVSGKTATVSLEAVDNSSVVVAIYDDKTDRMLASGTKEISAGDETANVVIDIDTMPQYFNLRAYIVDTETLRPLCTAYNCPLYTQEMQELMAMSAEEFEPERVLNLDDDTDNNFAVYDENTKFIQKSDDSNRLVSVDEENYIYVIENADSDITDLKPGDIFTYDNDDDVLIVKVSEITLDGNTATIKGAETNLDEVFDYVKIDAESGLDNAEVDPSTCDEDVTYVDENEANPYAIRTLASLEGSHNKTLNFNFDKSKQNKDGTIQFRVAGSIKVDLVATAKVYVTLTQQYLEVNLNYNADINAELEATGDVSITLANVLVTPVTGVTISITPAFVAQWTVQGELNGNINGTLGLQVSNQDGIKNISKMPTFDAELTVEGRLFVGFHLDPKVTVLGVLAQAQISGNPGVELTAKASANATNNDTSKSEHACNFCIAGDISAVINLTFEVKFLNSDKLKFSFKLIDKKIKIFDFYYSVDFNEYGLTNCPHKQYLLNVTVIGVDGNPVNKAVVNDKYVTDINGRTSFYLTPGNCTLTAKSDNATASKTFRMTAEPASILINLNQVNIEPTEATEATEATTKPTEPPTQPPTTKPTTQPTTKPTTKPTTQPTTPPVTEPPKKERQISLGQNHSGIVLENGDLYMWGYNWNGQLGNGTYSSDATPPVKVMSNVKAISLGDSHSAAITQNGDLYMWGSNVFGQLGDGTANEKHAPVKVMSNVKAVSLGNAHSAAIKENGDLYIWGNNGYGQLGDGTDEKSVTPIKVMSNVKAVSLGHSHSAAVKENGDLYTWGYNYFGQLGDKTSVDKKVPTKIMSNVKDVELGYHHSGAITQSGDLYTWGHNSYGQLGNGTSTNSDSPAKVLSNVKEASFYYYNSGALTENGYLYVWGDNSTGQLGIGTAATSKQTPTITMTYIKTFAVGMRHVGAIYENGDLYMWGNNGLGQLGDGTTTNRYFPTKITTIPSASTASLRAIAPVYVAKNDGSVSFDNLLSGEIYNFYAMKSRDTENPLSSDNLLYITQAVSDENGELTVNYLPTEEYEDAVCFVVPMKQTDLSKADVTVDALIYNGDEQFVSPEVMLNGKKLSEGADYMICGDYSATDIGEYNITIRGIGIHTGAIKLTYNVLAEAVPGDVNGNGTVDIRDATLIQMYCARSIGFTDMQKKVADINGDGDINIADVTAIQKFRANIIESF